MRFSVVVPARDEADRLPGLMRALAAQTLAPAEVVVVDNASADGTAAVARAWGARVIVCARPGVAYARQAGLEGAREAWVATTDADSQPHPRWLERLAAAAPGRAALTGPLRFTEVGAFTSAASEAGYRAFSRALVLAGRPNFAGANMAFDRLAALAAGGYPEVEAREDVLLGLALARAGRVAYVPDALVFTSGRRLRGGWARFLWRHARNLAGHTSGYFDSSRGR